MNDLPVRRLGSTGVTVTALGMGGEGVLRTFGYAAEAHAVIDRALDEGISYFESARAYSGSESYYGAALGPRRERVLLASKAHDRTRTGALAQLEASLRALRTEYLDVWQLHDVREWAELEAMEWDDGAYAAFADAKQRGLVRFIGVTGHHDPAVLREACERFRFDTVLLPVNPAEAARNAFAREVIPAARARGMAVIAMKVLARGLLLDPRFGLSARELVRYALSHDVDLAVIGFDDPGQVAAAAAAARAFAPLGAEERERLERHVAPAARHATYYRRPEPSSGAAASSPRTSR